MGFYLCKTGLLWLWSNRIHQEMHNYVLNGKSHDLLSRVVTLLLWLMIASVCICVYVYVCVYITSFVLIYILSNGDTMIHNESAYLTPGGYTLGEKYIPESRKETGY